MANAPSIMMCATIDRGAEGVRFTTRAEGYADQLVSVLSISACNIGVLDLSELPKLGHIEVNQLRTALCGAGVQSGMRKRSQALSAECDRRVNLWENVNAFRRPQRRRLRLQG